MASLGETAWLAKAGKAYANGKQAWRKAASKSGNKRARVRYPCGGMDVFSCLERDAHSGKAASRRKLRSNKAASPRKQRARKEEKKKVTRMSRRQHHQHKLTMAWLKKGDKKRRRQEGR